MAIGINKPSSGGAMSGVGKVMNIAKMFSGDLSGVAQGTMGLAGSKQAGEPNTGDAMGRKQNALGDQITPLPDSESSMAQASNPLQRRLYKTPQELEDDITNQA